MARRVARKVPPPLELECLSVLWKQGETNVRGVQEALAVERSLAYTTVMTMLERLARKQLVTRRKSGRHFVYAPAVERASVRQHAVRDLIDSLFDGSAELLAAFLSSPDAAPAPMPGVMSDDAVSPANPEPETGSMDAVLL